MSGSDWSPIELTLPDLVIEGVEALARKCQIAPGLLGSICFLHGLALQLRENRLNDAADACLEVALLLAKDAPDANYKHVFLAEERNFTDAPTKS